MSQTPPVRNIGDIQRRDPNTGQALTDILNQIRNLQAQLTALAARVTKLGG
jgi:hypothetical protein